MKKIIAIILLFVGIVTTSIGAITLFNIESNVVFSCSVNEISCIKIFSVE